jgi:MFS family permease
VSERRRRFSVIATWYCLLALVGGSNLLTPLYGLYMASFRLTPLQISSVYLAYVAVVVLTLPLLGSLADVYGRRRILLLALAISLASALAFESATGIFWLWGARAIQGLAIGLASGAAAAALIELAATRRRAAIYTTLALLGGSAGGPLLAGILAQTAPDPLRLPFVVYSCLAVPGLVAVWLSTESLEPSTRAGWRVRGLRLPPPPDRAAFVTRATVGGLAWSVNTLFLILVPSYVSSLLHLHNLVIAGGIVAVYMIVGALAQVGADRLSPRRAALVGLLMLCGCVSALVAAAPGGLAGLLVLAILAGGAGQGLAFSGSLALASELLPASGRSEVLSAFYAIIYAITAIFALGVGWAATRFGLLVAFAAFGAAIVVVSALVASSRGLASASVEAAPRSA